MFMRFNSNESARSLRPLAVTIAVVLIAASADRAPADIAATVGNDGPAIAFNSVDTTQGWRFTVDAPIIITALGLLDSDLDGFATSHQVGVWDEQGALVVAGTLQAGTVHPLVNRFRYASIEDGSASTLEPGQTYTIGYTLEAFSADAYVLHNVHTMHPVINQVGGRFFTLGSAFAMPSTAGTGQCFGPNFEFEIVPGPSAGGLLALWWSCMRRKRKE